MRTNFIKDIKEKIMRTKFIREKFMKKMIGVFAVSAVLVMLGLILTCENTLYKNEAKKAAPKTEEKETGGGYYYPTYPQFPTEEEDEETTLPAERVIEDDDGKYVLTLIEILEDDEPVENISGAMFSVNRPVLSEKFNYTLVNAFDNPDKIINSGTVTIVNYTKWTFTPAVVGEPFAASVVGGYLEFDADAVIYDESELPEGEVGENVDNSNPTTITIPKLGGGNVLAAVDEKEEKEEVKVIKVKSLALNESTLTLEKDETFTLEATIVTDPADAEVEIWWGSSKSAVASVTQDGVVTAKKGGTVTIKAIAGTVTAECAVTVPLDAGLYIGESSDPVDLSLAEGETVTIAKALAWINTNGVNEGQYTILLGENETEETSVGYEIKGDASRKNLKITLRGMSTDAENPVTITKNAAGPLFAVYGFDSTDVPELILENITLEGYAENTSALVVIGNGTPAKRGKLTMKDGSRITGNKNSNSGGGVSVLTNSSFTMEGGKIDNNETTFASGGGGGVLSNGVFTMTKGNIENNKSKNIGGGVWTSGAFEMNGGTISGNVCEGSMFSTGGGVYATGNFTMSGNTVIKNNSAPEGGGVAFDSCTFKMEGGSIEGNSATNGAAIFRLTEGRFIKEGGTVYGLDEADKSNIPQSGRVIAIMSTYGTSLVYFRDETAGLSVSLDSTTAENWGTP